MINQVVLMGRLIADPELRTTTTGKSVCSFCVAVDRSYAKSGEQKQTDFINIVAWESTADFVSKYFSKGSMIAVIGKIQTRSYEDKDGKKRTAFEVLTREVSFCGSKAQTNATTTAQAAPTANTQSPSFDDFEEIGDDEDVPF